MRLDESIELKNKKIIIKEMATKINPKYTHFAVRKSDNKIINGWDYSGLDTFDIKSYFKTDMDDIDYNLSDVKLMSRAGLQKQNIDPFNVENWYNYKETNINEMAINNNSIRKMMQEMSMDDNVKDCMYEVLTLEGFLPETLSEGETYEGIMSTMMEDDEILSEMYKSCTMSESDCGSKMESWLNEKLSGNQYKIDANKDGKISGDDFKILRKDKTTNENRRDEFSPEANDEFNRLYDRFKKQVFDAFGGDSWRNKTKTSDNEDNEVESGDITEITDNERYEEVIFLQGEEAEEVLDILNNEGEDVAFEYLKQWHDPGSHMGTNEIPKGTADKTFEKDGYMMSWNNHIGYIGLTYDTQHNELGGDEQLNEDKAIMGKFQDQYGKKRGKEIYYATANKQNRNPETFKKDEGQMYEGDHPEGEHYRVKITQICNDISDIYRMIDDSDELPSWIQDKIAVMYHSADAIKSYLSGEADEDEVMVGGFSLNEADDMDDDDIENPTYIMNKKRVLDTEIGRYIKYVNKFIPMLDNIDETDLNQYFQPETPITIDGFKMFLTKDQDESNVEYYERINQTGDWNYRSAFDGLSNPRKRGFFIKYGDKLGMEVSENMEDSLSDIFDMANSIFVRKKEVEKLEQAIEDRKEKSVYSNDGDEDVFDDDMVEPDGGVKIPSAFFGDDFGDDDEMLEEITYPVKGKNVDSENKTNSAKENTEATEDAEKSQETTQEKVENLKNQKYEKNDYENEVSDVMHGWRNNLDLDYTTNLSKDKAEKIADEASGLAPEDHANVDHESKAGEKMLKSAKDRAKDEFINNDDYTSKHDRTQIEKGQTYKKTTIFDKINESDIEKEISRLKNLFSYEDKIINENKKHKIDENDVFLNILNKMKKGNS